MSPRRRPRALAVAMAVLVTTGIGAGAAGPSRPVWSHPTRGGPWGLAADRAGVVVVTDAAAVLALDRAGHVRWRADVDSVVEAKPAVGGGRVLVGGRGVVTELSRATGARAWQQPMGGKVTSVALTGDLALAGDHAGSLVAFDARTGDRRWSARFDGRPWSAPQIDRGERLGGVGMARRRGHVDRPRVRSRHRHGAVGDRDRRLPRGHRSCSAARSCS